MAVARKDSSESNSVSSASKETSPRALFASSPVFLPFSTYNKTGAGNNGAVYNPKAIPKTPLRVPQKRLRRTLPPIGRFDPRISDGPPSPASTIVCAGHIAPSFKAESTGEGDRDEVLSSPAAAESSEEQWFAHRESSRRFLVIVGVVTVVLLATLAFGLPLGLRNKVSTQGNQSDETGDGSSVSFPAGSYTFRTALQKTDAGCTSRNTTWRCDPLRPGDSTTFYWEITQINYYTYTIASNENPFAPDFKNISMKMRDFNRTNERLEFSFLMNKTVVPSDAGSPTNRAATCTFVDTIFQATLYTRKRGDGLILPDQLHRVKGSAWPGDVDIVQSLTSTIGQPQCRDAKNSLIADVGASAGTCLCQYTNLAVN